MRTLTLSLMGAVVAASVAGTAAALAPASGTIVLRATATFSDGTSADRLFEVSSDTDSDGDGLNDSGWLRVACDGTTVGAVHHSVKSPRDSASGQSSGKRTHHPVTITKEWGPSTPMFRAAGGGKALSWDLGTNKGGRSAGPRQSVDHSAASDASAGKGAAGKTMAHDSWTAVTLTEGSPNLCA